MYVLKGAPVVLLVLLLCGSAAACQDPCAKAKVRRALLCGLLAIQPQLRVVLCQSAMTCKLMAITRNICSSNCFLTMLWRLAPGWRLC